MTIKLLLICLLFSNLLYSQNTDSVQLLLPVYENSLQFTRVHPLKYKATKRFHISELKDSLKTGCNFISERYIPENTILKSYNICDSVYIHQIIKTESVGYLGYLEELLNLPYVLSPRIYKGSHQTEMKLAVDCVSLVIYGRRRMGYKIPYCTPLAIKKYLHITKQYKAGNILHFGSHLAVLYKIHNPQQLQPHDLIIHAFKDKAEITPIELTEFYTKPYELYEWKD